MVGIAVCCALLSAVCLAYGAQRQGSAVRSDTGGLALNTSGFLRLLGNRRWMFGLLLLGLGMALNVAALAMASLLIVQPLGAIALVITTLVNSREQGIRLTRMMVVAVSACVVGSAMFVLLAVNVVQEGSHITVGEQMATTAIVAVVVIVLAALTALFRRRLGAFAYIVGAGVLFGFVAVLTRIIATELLRPNGLFIANVEWYTVVALAAAGGLGAWFVQSAYSSGPPDLVIAGLTVIDPMVGIAVSIVVLGEARDNVPAVLTIAMGMAALIAIVGVVALSRHHPDVTKRK